MLKYWWVLPLVVAFALINIGSSGNRPPKMFLANAGFKELLIGWILIFGVICYLLGYYSNG